MKRFVLTLNVIDLIRIVISFFCLILLVFLGYMFISGTWTFASMIDSIQAFGRWVFHNVGKIISDVWDKNKMTIIPALTVLGIGGLIILIMEGD